MSEEIAINAIEPNPWQSRQTTDKNQIDRLATEIKEVGFWDVSLRVRQVNGRYQLVAGHQRLEALKQLGHKRVSVEVVKLDDVQMAEQSLIENLQRDNLLEIDKAEAIKRLVKMHLDVGDRRQSERAVIIRLSSLLGYAHRKSLDDYLRMADLSPETKKVVRQHNTKRDVVRTAHYLGGDEMVRHAADKKIGFDALERMGQAVRELPKERQPKIVKQIVEHKLTNPEEVVQIARREASKTAHKNEMPPDLMVFIMKWNQDMAALDKHFKAASKYKDYVHKHPEVVNDVRTTWEGLTRTVNDFLKLKP